ncbi:putative E3 ubiquitin-protein ligase ARI9, partial [Cucurbita argyrosperma subsp. argyrosperma]
MVDGTVILDSGLDDDELAYDLQLKEVIALSQTQFSPPTSYSPPPSASSRSSPFLDDDNEMRYATNLWTYLTSDDDGMGYDYRMPSDTDVSALLDPLFDSESYRLYFKGLVGKETAGDVTIIAVAVFDSRDDLLIHVRKPLEAARENEAVSPEVAELMALIKGLEAALSLHLERVSFFCDDYMLHQYVTGRLRPKLSKIASLVEKVAFLRVQFSYCEPFLVEQNVMKSAFKLVEQATASQITLPDAETSNTHDLLENCEICYVDNELDQMYTVNDCLHRYCFSCMKKHVEVKFLDGSEAKCPHEGCKSTVGIENFEKLFPPKVIEIIHQRFKESSIPFSEKVYCPQPRCSALMSKTEVLDYTKDILGNAEQSGARKCMKCHGLFCIKCKATWHNDMTCEEYRKSSHGTQTEDAKLNSLAKEKLWQPCLRCGHLVELAEGCFHIVCRCGHEFCYSCGAEWKNRQPTCLCPMWDEHLILNDEQ